MNPLVIIFIWVAVFILWNFIVENTKGRSSQWMIPIVDKVMLIWSIGSVVGIVVFFIIV